MAMKFFRKHQKVILACITIGTMFLFIVGDAITMSTRNDGGRGGVSLWTRIKRWFVDDENAVVKVAGATYDPDQMRDLFYNRYQGYMFVTRIMGEARYNYRLSIGLTEEDMRDEQKARTKENDIVNKDPSKGEPLSKQTRDSLIFQAFRLTAPYDNEAAAVSEYLVLRNKADTLGVTVTPAVIKDDLVSILGMNQYTEAQLAAMVRAMGRQAGTSIAKPITKLDDLVAVLSDELRVAIAKSVVQGGQEPMNFMLSSTPGGVTPADLWQAYVKVKTSLTVGIAPYKVEDYVSRVAEPSAEEVKQYFEKYKLQYPDPDRDTPGFRVPPMYRIGFLHGDLTETKAARKQYNAFVDAMDQFNPITSVGLLAGQGMSPGGMLLSTLVAAGPAHELGVEYAAQKFTTYRQIEPFVEFAVSKQPGAAWLRVYRPKADHAGTAAFVASAGAALGQASLIPGDFIALTQPPRGQVVPAGQNDALNLASALGAALGASNLSGTVLVAPKVREGMEDTFIPFTTVHGAMLDKRYEKKSREYLMNDLTELSTQLSNYAERYREWKGKVLRKTAPADQPPFFKEDTKQSLQDYLTKFAAARGLTYHETKDLRSRVDLLKETEPLLNKYIFPIYADETVKTQLEKEERVKMVLVRDELNPQGREGMKPRLFDTFNSALFKPQHKEIVLHWVTETTDPKTPTLDEARPHVVRAWKLEKARTFAEQAALDMIKEVKKAPDNTRLLNDIKGYTPGQTIAEYSEPAIRGTSPGPTYQRCPIPPAIDYPPADLVQQCLTKLKTDGDLTVVPNKPKDMYYLLYLSHRTEPKLSNPLDVEMFHTEIIRASAARQMTVNGGAFKSFAADEKTAATQKAWEEYVKTLTSFNAEKAKEYGERLKQQN